jgi:hypothetical protein
VELQLAPVGRGQLRERVLVARLRRRALIMYDTETLPVRSAPAAECVTVEGGKITHSWFIFDRAPFEAARRAAG